jgi:hypothetical protein
MKKLEQVDDISFREQSVVLTKEDLTQGICIKVDYSFLRNAELILFLFFSFEWGSSRFFSREVK